MRDEKGAKTFPLFSAFRTPYSAFLRFFVLFSALRIPHSAFVLLGFLLIFAPNARAQTATTQTLTAKRIVSLVPSATETLFALGAQDRLVGVSSSCQWPPEARRLPQISGTFDPQIDQIVSLKPDLVLLSKNHILHIPVLRGKGIRTLMLPSDSIEQALVMIRDLSFLTGKQDLAKKLCNDIVKRLNALDARDKKLPRQKVLLSFYHEDGPLNEILALGPGNYLDEAIGVAGGQNVVTKWDPEGTLTVRMLPVDMKQAQPDVVIDLRPAEISPQQRHALEGQWRQLLGQKTRVIVLYDLYLGVPGIHMPETIEKLAQWIHGGAQPVSGASAMPATAPTPKSVK